MGIQYDVIIIGAGPAGMSAAIYAARYGMKSLMLTQDIGGQIATADVVENYPGYKSISGNELMQKFFEQVKYVGCEVKYELVTDIKKDADSFRVFTDSSQYTSKTIVIASGQKRRKLEVPGEEEFAGKGVSYCATCDGAFFRNKVVAVIGGGDAAIKAVSLLSQNAKHVYMLVRKDKLKGEYANVKKLENFKNLDILFNTEVSEIIGKKFVEKIRTKDGKLIDVNGVFIEIGGMSNSDLFAKIGGKIDERGSIMVNDRMETNIPGLFAAGDVTNYLPDFRQAIVSAAMGSIAAHSAFTYITHKEHKE